MAVQKTLEMDFATDFNKTHRIRVYDPREDITSAEISTAMDNIINANIFYGAGGNLTGKLAARVTTRATTDYAVV